MLQGRLPIGRAASRRGEAKRRVGDPISDAIRQSEKGTLDEPTEDDVLQLAEL